MTSEMIYVEGVTRAGNRYIAYTHINQFPGLVERRWHQQWQQLTVRSGGRDGTEIGRISRDSTGRRVRWTADPDDLR